MNFHPVGRPSTEAQVGRGLTRQHNVSIIIPFTFYAYGAAFTPKLEKTSTSLNIYGTRCGLACFPAPTGHSAVAANLTIFANKTINSILKYVSWIFDVENILGKFTIPITNIAHWIWLPFWSHWMKQPRLCGHASLHMLTVIQTKRVMRNAFYKHRIVFRTADKFPSRSPQVTYQLPQIEKNTDIIKFIKLAVLLYLTS